MSLAWWLFVKADESMRVDVDTPVKLVISGPGPHRAQHAFADEQALAAFAVQLEEELVSTGWTRAGFSAERRSYTDRRAIVRATSDRRDTVSG